MSAMQNFKNFIRHGKQARNVNAPPADAVTNVSPVHAERDKHRSPPALPAGFGVTEPAPTAMDHKPVQGQHAAGEFSAANVDQRNVAAQAGGTAARAAEQHQKIHQDGRTTERKKDYDPSVIERIVAEERESKGKLPKYPGLERYRLIEKMGDGAFSNVYRAKDLQGEFDEVAVKVVRKFEMNSSQVSRV